MHTSAPPEPVTRPVMRHRWDSITFIHWPYDVADVQRHLPRGLEVEPWEGKAWVGLVPFEMHLGGPAGPGSLSFPETNVRTYVVGPDGRPGVWFFSLDAASTTAVTAARATWQLPYHLATMSVEETSDTVRYRSRRRPPSRRRGGHDIAVRPGDETTPTEFDHYLTARFTLWNVVAGQVTRTQAEHPPWRLQRARVDSLDEDLLAAAGLIRPTQEPLVHFSVGTNVRIGAPRLVSRRERSASVAAG